MNWWSVLFICPECNIRAQVRGAFFSADAEWLFLCRCPKCQIVYNLTMNGVWLAEQARQMDAQPTANAKDVRPKQLSAPKITVQDIQFLKERGIRYE